MYNKHIKSLAYVWTILYLSGKVMSHDDVGTLSVFFKGQSVINILPFLFDNLLPYIFEFQNSLFIDEPVFLCAKNWARCCCFTPLSELNSIPTMTGRSGLNKWMSEGGARLVYCLWQHIVCKLQYFLTDVRSLAVSLWSPTHIQLTSSERFSMLVSFKLNRALSSFSKLYTFFHELDASPFSLSEINLLKFLKLNKIDKFF